MRRALAQALLAKAGQIRWHVALTPTQPDSVERAWNDLALRWADLLEAISEAFHRDPYG